MKELPDIYISLAAGIPEEVVSDVLDEVKASGFNSTLERREPEIFAAFEWLVPTAVMLFLGRKFIDTFAEEAAKDVYPLVKAALLRLIRRTSGPKRIINPFYVSSVPHKVTPGPAAALTVLIITAGGLRVRFWFPPDLPESLHAVAFEGLLAAAKQLEFRSPEPFTDSNMRPPSKSLILTFDSAAAAWQEVDLLVEAHAAREPSEHD